MLWRLPDGRRLTLVSNSDAHSLAKLGREANVFKGEMSYRAIRKALIDKKQNNLLYTIEFFPEEGKYHYDGHRNCGVRLSPSETKKCGGICPVCGRPLTVGVLSRIEELADKPEGFRPEDAIPFKRIIPLKEIIGEAFNVGATTKEVEKEYNALIEKFGSELEILLGTPIADLKSATFPEVAEAIHRVREGKVHVSPGYDGVYGKIKIFSKEIQKEKFSGQKSLF